MSSDKNPKRRRNTHQKAEADTPAEVQVKSYDEIKDENPVLRVVKHPFLKRYRIAWTLPNGGWYFAGEDTTEYTTREGADVAQHYLGILIMLNNQMHGLYAKLQEYAKVLAELQPDSDVPVEQQEAPADAEL